MLIAAFEGPFKPRIGRSRRNAGRRRIGGGSHPRIVGDSGGARGVSQARVAASAILYVALLACGAATGAERPGRHDVLAEFDVPGDGDVLLVPLAVGDRRFRAEIDTGTNLNYYDASLRELLGPARGSTVVRGALGDVSYELRDAPRAFVGALPVKGDDVAVDPELRERIADAGHMDVRCILGMDFLKDYVLRIDFDAGKLQFLRSAGPDPGLALPMQFDSGQLPVVTVRLGNGRLAAKFILDTGNEDNGGALIDSAIFNRLSKAGDLVPLGTADVRALSIRATARFGQLQTKFELGPFWHEGLMVTETKLNALSLSYLSRFTVTIDFPNKVLYLKTGRRFAAPLSDNRSGMQLKRKGALTVVATVDPETLAADLGIMPGDIVLSVGDLDGATARLYALEMTLCEPTVVRVRFERDHRHFEFDLDLHYDLPPGEPDPSVVRGGTSTGEARDGRAKRCHKRK